MLSFLRNEMRNAEQVRDALLRRELALEHERRREERAAQLQQRRRELLGDVAEREKLIEQHQQSIRRLRASLAAVNQELDAIRAPADRRSG